METIQNAKQGNIAFAICDAIHNNAAYLSEIDGATGDGDHGVNMNKGFLMAKDRIQEDMSFSEAIQILGRTLVMDIGGSMGPIYGTMFSKISKVLKKEDQIDKHVLYTALFSAFNGLMNLAGAQQGDKTLLDTIGPACTAFKKAIDANQTFVQCLTCMREGAIEGRDSTKDMVAKIGRAARLGERSRGFLDAGATSCCIILCTMADVMIQKVSET